VGILPWASNLFNVDGLMFNQLHTCLLSSKLPFSIALPPDVLLPLALHLILCYIWEWQRLSVTINAEEKILMNSLVFQHGF